EGGGHRADHAIHEHVLAHLLRHRLQVLDRQIRIESREQRRYAPHHLVRIHTGTDVERQESDTLRLPPRDKEERRNVVLYLAVLRILHQPDDLHVEFGVTTGAHALAHDVPAEVELRGERLVHHNDIRAALVVGGRELAPGENRNTERPEVCGPDLVVA